MSMSFNPDLSEDKTRKYFISFTYSFMHANRNGHGLDGLDNI